MTLVLSCCYRSSRASSDTVSSTFTYHTWQFIIFTIFTVTTFIFSFTHLVFHSELKTWLFDKSCPPFSSPTGLIPRTLERFYSLNGWICLQNVLDYKPALCRFSNALEINVFYSFPSFVCVCSFFRSKMMTLLPNV